MPPPLESLETRPRPPGCRKLDGDDHESRIRINDYRFVYVIGDAAETVDVTRIARRGEIYD
jgi:mRNA interferase RelE/StbE